MMEPTIQPPIDLIGQVEILLQLVREGKSAIIPFSVSEPVHDLQFTCAFIGQVVDLHCEGQSGSVLGMDESEGPNITPFY